MTTNVQQSGLKDSSLALPMGAAENLTPSIDVLASHNAGPPRPRRSLGLKLVDTLVYPIINNFGVFAVSVAATYLTKKGWPEPANGKPLAPWKKETGAWFKRRGDYMEGVFQNKMGMSKDSADMARMVFFSFADGTIIAPFVKLLEDRREQTAKWIDKHLGHKHEDVVYKAEPKQTWGSVIEGRLLTSLIVVPTAVALDNTGLNDKLFKKPGVKFGERVDTKMPKFKGWLERRFGKVDMPYFFETVSFEMVYTSICTAGLYFISRLIAKQRDDRKQIAAENAPAFISAPETSSQEIAPAVEKTAGKPSTAVTQTTHHQRVSAAPAQEITA